jgi:hypothetical protein
MGALSMDISFIHGQSPTYYFTIIIEEMWTKPFRINEGFVHG